MEQGTGKKKNKVEKGEVVPTAITLIKKVQIVKGAWGIRKPNVLTAVNERGKCQRNGPSSSHLFASHVLHLVIKRIIISYGKQSYSFSYFPYVSCCFRYSTDGERF